MAFLPRPRRRGPIPCPLSPPAATLLAAFLLTLAACGGSDGTDSERVEAKVPLVEAVEARSGALPLTERLSGVVEARNQVAVRSEIEGRVVEVLVRNGESVREGQALVRLDDATLRERLRQAEAGVRVAEATAASARARVAELDARVTRSRTLAEQDLIPDVDLETLEAQVDAARAEADEQAARVEEARSLVEERRAALDRATVRSPVAGKVGRRDVEVGMLVDPGQALFRVGDTEQVIVEVSLTEDMLAYLDDGQPVEIYPGRGAAESADALEAKLSRISPFLAEDSFSTVAEIDVDNADGRLRPGMFVTVDVLYGQTEQATLVPSSALWEDPQDGEIRVFVLEDGAGTPIPSEDAPLGVEVRDDVEILAQGRGSVGLRGVEPGERVVTVGQHLISQDDDARVRVRLASWQEVQELQSLQREDLLANHMAKQRRLAREMGAEPPSNEDYMNLGESAAADAAGAAPSNGSTNEPKSGSTPGGGEG